MTKLNVKVLFFLFFMLLLFFLFFMLLFIYVVLSLCCYFLMLFSKRYVSPILFVINICLLKENTFSAFIISVFLVDTKGVYLW